MSERLFRAVRDFVSVRLPLYLRVFAIFLIFASPVVLVSLYFDTLDHFNKAMYHIPSFALLALSAIIFYRLRWYAYYDQDPWAADRDLLELPRHLRLGSSSESQSCCCLSAAFFCQGLYEQAALQETAHARSRDPSNSQPSLCLSFLLRRRESASGTTQTR
jgi:hypothetical protein